MVRAVLLVWTMTLAACGESDHSPVAPTGTAAKQVLVVTHTAGFRHGSIPIAEQTLEELGRESGAFAVRFCRTGAEVRSALAPSALASLDAVVFANTTGDLGVPDLPAFLDWIAAGHGFVGVHSAADT